MRHRFLWAGQLLLALAFMAAGGMKLITPRAELAANPAMAWAQDFSESAIKLIGTAEVLGALGLIVPMATGILPVLTPVASVGLAALMVGAVATHLRRGESFVPPLVPGLLALTVAFARWRHRRRLM